MGPKIVVRSFYGSNLVGSMPMLGDFWFHNKPSPRWNHKVEPSIINHPMPYSTLNVVYGVHQTPSIMKTIPNFHQHRWVVFQPTLRKIPGQPQTSKPRARFFSAPPKVYGWVLNPINYRLYLPYILYYIYSYVSL